MSLLGLSPSIMLSDREEQNPQKRVLFFGKRKNPSELLARVLTDLDLVAPLGPRRVFVLRHLFLLLLEWPGSRERGGVNCSLLGCVHFQRPDRVARILRVHLLDYLIGFFASLKSVFPDYETAAPSVVPAAAATDPLTVVDLAHPALHVVGHVLRAF